MDPAAAAAVRAPELEDLFMPNKYLVVDDDADFRDLLCNVFCDDTDIMTAQNGREALALMEAHRFDIVLTDYNMPVMGGIEFLERAGETDSDIYLHSILMTGSSDKEVMLFSERSGVTLMIKPFPISQLKETVKVLLEGRNFDHPRAEGVAVAFRLNTKIPADEGASL